MYKEDVEEIFRLKAEVEEKNKDLENMIQGKLESFKMKFGISLDIKIKPFKKNDNIGIILTLPITKGYTITNIFMTELKDIMKSDIYNQVFEENSLEMAFFY